MVFTHLHTYMHAYIYIYIVFSYIHTYIHRYIHIHTCPVSPLKDLGAPGSFEATQTEPLEPQDCSAEDPGGVEAWLGPGLLALRGPRDHIKVRILIWYTVLGYI